MLDIKRIRREPDAVRAALERRGAGSAITRLIDLDEQWREVVARRESSRALQRQASEVIAQKKKEGGDISGDVANVKNLSTEVKELSEQQRELEENLERVLQAVPNLPDPDAPLEDTVLREVGEAGRTGRDHLELAGAGIDIEAGARVSGSRFAFLRGDVAMLEMALMRWALDQVRGHGHEPVLPPVLVREEAMYGTGMLPDTEQQIYRVGDDDLYLVGTSEVPLASLHAGEIVDAERLPLRYAGFSPCFRREAGAAGRDSRGIFRVHQFDKVEMFAFVAPDESAAEHERLLAIEEEMLQALGLPYRVVNIAVSDLGASAAKKYDCEGWLPGQGAYRELTSCSNTTDYQARRLDIRHRPEGGKPETLHTLNGTAVTDRWLIAVLENGQRDDGSVAIPEPLVAYGAPSELPAAVST